VTVAGQDDIVAFLGRGSTYGRRSRRVQRIDTHGAIVFLVGRRVYKLKRAVTFSYMDFSTVAKRRAVCRAEVTLNRRTAPQLYLGLMPVVARGSGLALGKLCQPDAMPRAGHADVRDWLVVMKRFPAGALFDRIAVRRGVRAEEAEAIAEAIVRFHAAAPKATRSGQGRSPDWVAAGNLAELERRTPGLFARSDVERLKRGSNAALKRLRGLFAARRRAGFVRRVHGDLHLRNICEIGGRPVLFDALEFDSKLATIDVLYDLAFLLMDMEHRGLHTAGNRLLNHYLAVALDPAAGVSALKGLAAFPLYLASRAAIRAHTEVAAADMQTDRSKAMDLRHEAKRYLRLANAFLDPPTPVLIAVGGLSGSGKTTLARALAPVIGAAPGAVVLRSDVIRKRLAGVHPLDRLPPSAYRPHETRRVYATINRFAKTILAAGYSVIADAVFSTLQERQAIERVASRSRLPFIGLWLDAPAPMLAKRLIARRFDASDATPSVLDRQLGYELGDLSWHHLSAAIGVNDVARQARRVVTACAPAALRACTPKTIDLTQ
jgi:aminoglycoside phosphotransferase family enzyme/predicted kinase